MRAQPRLARRTRRFAARAAGADPGRDEPRGRLRLVQRHAMAAWHGEGRFADLLKARPRNHPLSAGADDRRPVRHRLPFEARRHDLPPRFRRIAAQQEEPNELAAPPRRPPPQICRRRGRPLRHDHRRQTDADHRRRDRRRRSVAAARQPHPRRDPPRAGREPGHLLPRPAFDRRPAPGFRPPVRRPAYPSGRTLRTGQARIDDHPRRQGQPASQRRRLAFGRVVRSRAADGQHPLHQEMPPARRRHSVRQHVCRL